VLVAEVREAPDVAQAHGVAEAGEEEITLVVPGASLRIILAFARIHGGLFTRLLG
jgi:hypothetical protein